MEVGIVGLPVSGKTTLFSTLSGQSAEPGHGVGKIEVHRGVVKMPDERLDMLTEIFQPKREVLATIEYIEVGGLEQEVSASKGFDPQFLHVLKNFSKEKINLCLEFLFLHIVEHHLKLMSLNYGYYWGFYIFV